MTTTESLPQTATLFLCVHDGAAALDFYARAFGAEETFRMTDPSGKVGHAEMRIGNTAIMLSGEWPEGGVFSPRHYGGSTAAIVLSVPDCDAAYAIAVEAGATAQRPIQDEPYGQRSGWVTDPFGYRWNLTTPIEDVSNEQLQERVGAAYRVS